MREGDTGERDGDESLIEIGLLKERPVGDIKGKRRGEKEAMALVVRKVLA